MHVSRRTFKVVSHRMGHLDCFLPAMLALGSMHVNNTEKQLYLKDATDLTYGCWQLYNLSRTVGVESVQFGRNTIRTNKISNYNNMLRPEVAESLFFMWKITKNNAYRDMGWTMFTNFRKYSKFKNGYCSMENVNNIHCSGKMESFWIAETLKYMYLMFDDKININNWVFNTEAHPFPIIPNLAPCVCNT